MSLETWKSEFYRIPADSPELKTKAQRIEHSLMKWIGLTPENLGKHNCEIDLDMDVKGNESCAEFFRFGSSSCSLCNNYWCSDCPLRETLGYPCSDGDDSPHQLFHAKGNSEPMIEALAKTLDKELNK